MGLGSGTDVGSDSDRHPEIARGGRKDGADEVANRCLRQVGIGAETVERIGANHVVIDEDQQDEEDDEDEGGDERVFAFEESGRALLDRLGDRSHQLVALVLLHDVPGA